MSMNVIFTIVVIITTAVMMLHSPNLSVLPDIATRLGAAS